jgi:hypothetical protein
MKKALYILFFVLMTVALFAQAADNQGGAATAADLNLDEADPSKIGTDSAEQKLKEISIDKYETEGTWIPMMSADEGVIRGRLFKGAPAGKKPIAAEEGMNIPDEMVYGVRVDYFRRGYNTFTVAAVKPLPIEGITKTVSVWVVGRNYGHTLKLLLEDYWGTQFELYVGKLNHTGWKKMTVAIPPANPDGRSGIIQKDYHFGTKMGLRLVGFRVECDPMDAYGTYYIYFDDLRAVSDLYELEAKDLDDMFDNW